MNRRDVAFDNPLSHYHAQKRYVYTHYAPDEHDLYALREEAEKCEPRLKEIFPLETGDREELFDKLNLAYIGARYIKSFVVERNEIDYWKPEAEKLMSLTKQTCKIKIEALKQMENEYNKGETAEPG